MYSLIRARERKPVVIQNEELIDGRVMEYLTFPNLTQTGLVEHLFTSRIGGVSEGEYATMNLSFTRGDDPARVLENYKRVAKVLGTDVEHMVLTYQTHTTNIRHTSGADGGKGILREREYRDIDGLTTDEPGVALVCFFADCVPLYFVDPIHRAIGLAHSGWKGTVNGMGRCMAEEMGRRYGSRPEELQAAIGPSICQNCYEIGEEVAVRFRDFFLHMENAGSILQEIREWGGYPAKDVILPGREPGKYQLDLWLANLMILHGAGIPLQNIAVTDVCTCCNSQYLFSHRASKGKRGNLSAFLMLRKDA